MNKKRGKRAQFYILAAIIIVLIVISISSVVTYSVVRSQPKSIGELSQTLKIESNGLIKYGLYNQQNLTKLIENFTEEDFAQYFLLSPDYDTTNMTFVYGNKTQLVVVRYIKSNSGGAGFIGGPQYQTRSVNVSKTSLAPTPGTDMNITVSGKSYRFELQEGQIFYFVVSNYKEGEVYVQTSDSET